MVDTRRGSSWLRLDLFAVAMLAAGTVQAEPSGAAQKPVPAAPPAAQPQSRMPTAEQIVILIRSSLLTLNDAIETGNFTVLRDRGSPSFQGGEHRRAPIRNLSKPSSTRRRAFECRRHCPETDREPRNRCKPAIAPGRVFSGETCRHQVRADLRGERWPLAPLRHQREPGSEGRGRTTAIRSQPECGRRRQVTIRSFTRSSLGRLARPPPASRSRSWRPRANR